MSDISRRDLVVSASGAAVLGLCGPMAVIPDALAQTKLKQGFVNYDIGDVRCTSLYDGIWKKPHDANFIRNASLDDMKSALKQGGLTTEFMPIEFSQTVLKVGKKTVLVDSGTGGQLSPDAGMMMKNLKAAGVEAKSIDTILISHFHPDHIFGLMAKGTNEQIFPNAEIMMPSKEYKFWTDPSIVSKLPKRFQGLALRIQATFPKWKNITLFDEGEKQLLPGVRSIPAYGHTPGHTAFHVSSGDKQLIIAGDAANLPALFLKNPNWHLVFDGDPKAAQEARVKLFNRVLEEKAVVAGYHFGFPNAGKLEKDGKGFAFSAFTG